MSKNQQKKATDTANTALTSLQDQGKTNEQQLQGVVGGYQNNASSLFPGVSQGYADIASTGGYDPGQLDKINTGYGNMAMTGGFSPEDLAYMRNSAADTARSSYLTGQDQMQRNIAATGSGGGFGQAALGSLARQGSNAASTATNDVNSRIAGMTTQNKLAGLGGLGSTQQNVTQNRLAGMGGQSGLYNTNVAATQNTLDQIIKNFQVTGSISADDIKTLSQLASAQKGPLDNILSTIGVVGGAASGIMSGFGAMKGGGPTGTSDAW